MPPPQNFFFDFESKNGDFYCILGACPRGEGAMAPPAPLDPPVAMYHLENYCVRSAVYKIHAKHTLKRPRSHMGAVRSTLLTIKTKRIII